MPSGDDFLVDLAFCIPGSARFVLEDGGVRCVRLCGRDACAVCVQCVSCVCKRALCVSVVYLGEVLKAGRKPSDGVGAAVDGAWAGWLAAAAGWPACGSTLAGGEWQSSGSSDGDGGSQTSCVTKPRNRLAQCK